MAIDSRPPAQKLPPLPEPKSVPDDLNIDIWRGGWKLALKVTAEAFKKGGLAESSLLVPMLNNGKELTIPCRVCPAGAGDLCFGSLDPNNPHIHLSRAFQYSFHKKSR